MTTRTPSTLRRALGFLSLRLVLQQLALALIVFALYALWLHVPDANFLDVIATALLAILTLAVAGAGESALILHLSGQPRNPWKLLRGTLLLIAGAVLWLAWNALLSHFRGDYNQNDDTFAGYLNSRLPHALRYVFTYEHLLRWIGWAWSILQWIGTAAIAAFVIPAFAAVRPCAAIVSTLRSIIWWIAALLGPITVTFLTATLMQWTPGHGLRFEMLSLILRLSAAVLIDTAILCFLLAILAARIRQAGDLYTTPAGTPDPDDNQLRTAGNP
jgi:hypothetical protein